MCAFCGGRCKRLHPFSLQEGVVKGFIPSPFEGEGYDSMDGGGRAKQDARAEDEGD